MKLKTIAMITGGLVAGSVLCHGSWLRAQSKPEPLVRLAELEINPVQLEDYKVALREEIRTSVRVEPGVLKLYAVSVKGQPNHIRLFEMYADSAAYQAHLSSAHFQTYKRHTANMVRSLRLIETDPISLGSK